MWVTWCIEVSKLVRKGVWSSRYSRSGEGAMMLDSFKFPFCIRPAGFCPPNEVPEAPSYSFLKEGGEKLTCFGFLDC